MACLKARKMDDNEHAAKKIANRRLRYQQLPMEGLATSPDGGSVLAELASVSSSAVGIRYGAFALKTSSEIDPACWIAIGDRIRSKPFLPPLRRIQMSYHVRRIRRESPKSKPRSIKTLQKPNGVISPRVQKVGGEHFAIVCVDPAKHRSAWMMADYFGNVLIEPLR